MDQQPDRAALIEQLRTTPQHIAAAVRGLTEEQLTTPYMPGEWTVAQNVHHLVDSHIIAYARFNLVLTEDNPVIYNYARDTWAALPSATSPDLTHSLTILTGLHGRWAEVASHIAEDDWSRAGVHPVTGPLSLDAMLKMYAGHEMIHVQQIKQTLAAGGITL